MAASRVAPSATARDAEPLGLATAFHPVKAAFSRVSVNSEPPLWGSACPSPRATTMRTAPSSHSVTDPGVVSVADSSPEAPADELSDFPVPVAVPPFGPRITIYMSGAKVAATCQLSAHPAIGLSGIKDALVETTFLVPYSIQQTKWKPLSGTAVAPLDTSERESSKCSVYG